MDRTQELTAYRNLEEACERIGVVGSAAIARLFNVSTQVVTNWKRRGLPKERWPECAKALGITVESLASGTLSQHVAEPPAPYGISCSWPFLRITPAQWRGLTERQRGVVEGIALGMLASGGSH